MTSKDSKKPSESSIEDHTYKIFPNDLNSQSAVFGGTVLSLLDRIAVVVAERHSGNSCVTVSVDAVHFLAPARKGDNLICQASINRAWNSSMEIGLRITAEHPFINKREHILSAYFTFVALGKDGNKTSVPQVSPETEVEKNRYKEADLRRQRRIAAAKELAELRKSFSKDR